MTKRELAAFFLKLLGIYAIIQSLPLLIYISSFLGFPGDRSNEFYNVWMFISLSMPFLLTIVTAIVLLRYSRSLSSFIVKEDEDVKLSTAHSLEDFQAIGFSIVAVLVFLLAVNRIFQFIISLWYITSENTLEPTKSAYIRNAWQSGISVVVQVGLAIILFLRARGLANVWRSIQVGRYKKIEDVEQNTPGKS